MNQFTVENWMKACETAYKDEAGYEQIMGLGKDFAPSVKDFDDFILEYWKFACKKAQKGGEEGKQWLDRIRSRAINEPKVGERDRFLETIKTDTTSSLIPVSRNKKQKTGSPSVSVTNTIIPPGTPAALAGAPSVLGGFAGTPAALAGGGINTITPAPVGRPEHKQLIEDFLNQPDMKVYGLSAMHVCIDPNRKKPFLTPQGRTVVKQFKDAQKNSGTPTDKFDAKKVRFLLEYSFIRGLNKSHVECKGSNEDCFLNDKGNDIVTKHFRVQEFLEENLEAGLEDDHFETDSDGIFVLNSSGAPILNAEGLEIYRAWQTEVKNLKNDFDCEQRDEDIMEGIGAYYNEVNGKKWTLKGFEDQIHATNSNEKNTGLIIFLLKKVAVLSEKIRVLEEKDQATEPKSAQC